MNTDISIFSGDTADVAVLNRVGVSIVLDHDRPHAAESGMPPKRGRNTPAAPDDVPGTKESTAIPNLNLIPAIGGDLMPWGTGNDYPQRIVNLYNQDTIIPQTLGKIAAMVAGKGVLPVQVDIDDNGQEIARPVRDAEISAWLDSLDFRRYLREMSGDVTWFYNGFPEMILSKNRQKILYFNPLNAEECRWCRMKPSGDLPYIWLNANWPHDNTNSEYSQQINAIDPYRWDRVDWLRESSFYNCVYPLRYPTPGKRYYSLAHHYSIVESGWLDVHLAIPAFKKHLMKNQVSLKYHFKVDKEYWAFTYGEKYTKGSPEDKRTIKRTWLEGMTKTLTDVEKAGGSIITEMTWDKEKKIFIDHITITPVTDAMTDNKYIGDNLEAAANIFYALGVDPTLVGFAGGEKNGARSGGSDKREAYLIALQMMTPFRDMLLEPLEFVAEFNGWKTRYPNLKFQFRDAILTTLDTGAGTKKTLS